MGLALASSAVVGCAGGTAAKFAEVKAGEMPSGEAWDGVYFNAVYGYLHITVSGSDLVGRWKRKDGSKWGELSGTVDGNVAHVKFTEHTYGGIGPASDVHGTGVFAYGMSGDKIAKLSGQYALDDSDAVGQWDCMKQVGMKADLNSINGQSSDAAPVSNDHWQ
jgi:hypothetical protein